MSAFLFLPLLTSFLHFTHTGEQHERVSPFASSHFILHSTHTGQQHERVSPFCLFSPHSCILLTQVNSMSAFLLLPLLTLFLHFTHTGQQHERQC